MALDIEPIKISLDFYNRNIVCVNAKQLDSKSRYIDVTFTNQGKKITLDHSSVSVIIRYKKSDGYYCFNNAVEITDDGTALFELTQQMLAVNGKNIADIMVINSSGINVENISDINDIYDLNVSIISTMSFYINTESIAIDNAVVESSYEYDALTTAIATTASIESHMKNLEQELLEAEEQRVVADIERENKLKQKADKNNTVLTGSLSMGRKAGTTIGTNSSAIGTNVEASSEGSWAEGESTVSRGKASHSEGGGCQALGDYTHAEGCNDGDQPTTASCKGAHAEGMGTISSGHGSHSEGKGSQALREASHTEGRYTKVEGDCGHAEGENSTVADGAVCGHAEGYDCHANGKYTHAEGQSSTAHGNVSHVEGYGNTTAPDAPCAHAEGDENYANGYASHVEGKKNIANGEYQHVQGKYNVADNENKYANIVGGGTSDTDRKNIHTLDWEGNAEYSSDVVANVEDGKTPVSLIETNDLIKNHKHKPYMKVLWKGFIRDSWSGETFSIPKECYHHVLSNGEPNTVTLLVEGYRFGTSGHSNDGGYATLVSLSLESAYDSYSPVGNSDSVYVYTTSFTEGIFDGIYFNLSKVPTTNYSECSFETTDISSSLIAITCISALIPEEV